MEPLRPARVVVEPVAQDDSQIDVRTRSRMCAGTRAEKVDRGDLRILRPCGCERADPVIDVGRKRPLGEHAAIRSCLRAETIGRRSPDRR